MTEKLQSPELSEPVGERQVQAIGTLMGEILNEKEFSPSVLSEFSQQVLKGLEVNYVPDKTESHFYDVGVVEQGIPDGRYAIEIGGQSVANRAERLKGHVPEGTEQYLGGVWIIAHELGHGFQVAHGLAHKSVVETGFMTGLPHYPNLSKDLLDSNPELAMSEDVYDAQTIESERQAEGLANVVLVDALLAMGLSSEEALSAVENAGQEPRDNALKDPTPHKIGYANPLSEAELLDRFAA